MRESAQAVVIGGGVGGASVLRWLTKLGWTDIALTLNTYSHAIPALQESAATVVANLVLGSSE